MIVDVVIVGGGLVGASLACALSHTKLTVALIDSTVVSTQSDPRLIALNYHSVSFFKKIGIWEKLAPYATPIKTVHVSHRGHFGKAEMHATDLNLSELGFLVPAKYINTVLYASIPTTILLAPATLTNLEQHSEYASLTIHTAEGQQTLQTQLVVAADGTHSTVRELLQIPSTTFDYQQKAIVTMTELNRHHCNIAYERFTHSGAIAMLPLAGNQVATIWTDADKTIDGLLAMDDEAFLATLQNHFGYRLGRLCQIQQRFVFPLKRVIAAQQIVQRTILIGNAAHTIHPIAAQGLNLALLEIAELAEYFNAKPSKKISLPVELRSTQQQNQTIKLSHRLSWIFSTDVFLFNQSRQLGLFALDACLPLKRRFAKSAMALN